MIFLKSFIFKNVSFGEITIKKRKLVLVRLYYSIFKINYRFCKRNKTLKKWIKPTGTKFSIFYKVGT